MDKTNTKSLIREYQTANGVKVKAAGRVLTVNPGDVIGDWGNGQHHNTKRRKV